MRKYTKYKIIDSSLLKEIPSDWNWTKFKFIAEIYTGDSLNDDYKLKFESYNEDELPYISSKDINVDNSTIQYENGLRIPVGFEKFKVAPKGSALLCIEGGSAGRKMGYLNQDVCFVNKLACFNSGDDNISKFIYYCLRSHIFQTQFKNSIAGLIGGVSISNLKNFYVSIPPNNDVKKIVHYLDHQTSIIDQLIQKKEKLIELLKEKRQSIINEAVTKGLNPKDKMKDSGIEWLGEVPQKWDLVQIRHLNTKVGSGVTPKGGAEVYTEEGVIFIRSQNVHFDGLRLDDVVKIDFETHEKMAGSKVKHKDVLLNITGASIGRCCVVDIKEEMNVNQHVCIIRPNEKILPEFLNLVMQSNIGQAQIKLGTTGGNREGLTFEAIKEFIIPIPNISDQKEILENIQCSIRKYSELEYSNMLIIDKLKEYRQSIISEAVTGKIDVRDWQPKKEKVA